MAPDGATSAGALGTTRFRSMGCEVVVVAPSDRPDAARIAEGVFDAWDRRFSRFQPDSELSHLNAAAGRALPVSRPMLDAVAYACRAAEASGGLFDPLLGRRMVDLGYDRTFAAVPSNRRRDRRATVSAPHRPAWREIEIDDARGTVRIPAGYALDLGGLAKGMAVDAAVAALRDAGIPWAAVSAGGDLAVHGEPPGSAGWAVDIDNYRRGAILASGGLATSSVRMRRWQVDGVDRHHILDPRTGLPSTGPIEQATVAAPSCAQAEVAAKVAILSDLGGAVAFLESHQLAGVLLTDAGEAWTAGPWR